MAKGSISSNWKKEDDAKLAALFRKGPYKGVSTKDLNSKTIRKVLETYFPEKKYANFAPLFWRKARAFDLDKELSGRRKKKGELLLCVADANLPGALF